MYIRLTKMDEAIKNKIDKIFIYQSHIDKLEACLDTNCEEVGCDYNGCADKKHLFKSKIVELKGIISKYKRSAKIHIDRTISCSVGEKRVVYDKEYGTVTVLGIMKGGTVAEKKLVRAGIYETDSFRAIPGKTITFRTRLNKRKRALA